MNGVCEALLPTLEFSPFKVDVLVEDLILFVVVPCIEVSLFSFRLLRTGYGCNHYPLDALSTFVTMQCFVVRM